MNFYSKINFHLPELQMWKHILKQAQPVKFFFKKFVPFYVFLVKLKEKERLIQFSQRSYSSFWKEYLLKPGGLRWVHWGGHCTSQKVLWIWSYHYIQHKATEHWNEKWEVVKVWMWRRQLLGHATWRWGDVCGRQGSHTEEMKLLISYPWGVLSTFSIHFFKP